TAAAQTPTTAPPPAQSSQSQSSDDTRPATTTFFGDTGIWFVPTAEVLPRGKWSASGYRRGTNFIQGYTNVGDFAGTFGVGVGDGTGKADVAFDVIASKEAAKLVDWSGFAGYEFRGQPDNYDAPSGAFRWGTGVAFPSRNVVRIFGELNGTVPNKDTIAFRGATIQCVNCGVAPLTSSTENLTRATAGVTIQGRNGFFVGGGVSWNVPQQARDTRFTDDDV